MFSRQDWRSVPEEGGEEGAVIAARVPIYGTKDAGRGFWLRLKEVVLAEGYNLNQILPALFSLGDSDDKIAGVMSSNVDDFLYGNFCPHCMIKIYAFFYICPLFLVIFLNIPYVHKLYWNMVQKEHVELPWCAT